MYCRSSTRECGKAKNSLCVSQATKHLKSLIHHKNVRTLTADWHIGHCSLLPLWQRSSLDMTWLILDRTAQIQCSYVQPQEKENSWEVTKLTKFHVCFKGAFPHLCLPVSSPRETAVLPRQSKDAAAQPRAAPGTCCAHASVWWALPSQHNQKQGLPTVQLHQQHRSCPHSTQWQRTSSSRWQPFCFLL